MVLSFRKDNNIKLDFVIDLFLFAIIIVLAAIVLKPFFMSLLLALITAYALKPFVDLIYRFVKFYRLSLFIVFLIILIPTGAFMYYVAEGTAPIVQKTNEIVLSLDSLLADLADRAQEISILNTFNAPDYIRSLQNVVQELATSLKLKLLSMFQDLVVIVINVLIYIVTTYYFIIESNRVAYYYNILLKKVSKKRQVMLNALIKGVKNALDVLVISYITLTIIITVLSYVIYFAFSIPYAGLWAVLTGLFALLPILGAWMVYGGVSLYLYMQGQEIQAVVVLLYGLIVLTLLPEIVLKPMLSATKAKVHPLTVILGFFGGPLVFGMSGFILGPIIMVIFETVVKEYYSYYILSSDSNNDSSKDQ